MDRVPGEADRTHRVPGLCRRLRSLSQISLHRYYTPLFRAVMWIRIQRYKMKEKAEFNQQFFFFFVGNYIFQGKVR